MSNQHVLKIHPAPLADLLSGAKTAEVRRNDRGFEVGDTVRLMEVHPETGNWTGAADHVRTISHIQTGYGLPDGMCVLSYAQPFVPRNRLPGRLAIRAALPDVPGDMLDHGLFAALDAMGAQAEQQEVELWHCKSCRIESGGDGECPACDKPFEVGDLPKEAQGAQAGEFQREDRYIVIKRKDLAQLPMEMRLPFSMVLNELAQRLPKREYLVIESDWPEYEPTWAAIQARVEARASQLAAGDPVAKPDSSDTFYAGLYHKSSPMWHQLHELATSKGYDHVRYAIECAPVYKCDCRGARKVALDLEGRTMPCECVDGANDGPPASAPVAVDEPIQVEAVAVLRQHVWLGAKGAGRARPAQGGERGAAARCRTVPCLLRSRPADHLPRPELLRQGIAGCRH